MFRALVWPLWWGDMIKQGTGTNVERHQVRDALDFKSGDFRSSLDRRVDRFNFGEHADHGKPALGTLGVSL